MRMLIANALVAPLSQPNRIGVVEKTSIETVTVRFTETDVEEFDRKTVEEVTDPVFTIRPTANNQKLIKEKRWYFRDCDDAIRKLREVSAEYKSSAWTCWVHRPNERGLRTTSPYAFGQWGTVFLKSFF